MNKRIEELAEQAARFSATMALPTGESGDKLFVTEFAELIVKECIDTLEFHGFDDAIPYIKWMTTNRFGVE